RTTSYTYDKVGNRLTSTLGTASTSYAYDAADQLTSTTTGTTTTAYGYDAEGNQTKKGADTYTYDLAGQISAATVGGAAYTYDHDASGNQVATLKDGAVTHRTQWDPNAPLPILPTEYDSAWSIKQSFRNAPLGQPTSVKSGAGTLYYYHNHTTDSPAADTYTAGSHRTQWDPNAPLPILATEYDSAWSIKQSFRYDPLGQPTSVKTGAGTLFYYHHDTQGSPVDVTNSAGTLYQRWAYDPFGTRV